MTKLARLLISSALLLALVPAASARPREIGVTALEQAREERGGHARPLQESVLTPAGAFFAKPSEYLASANSDVTLVLDPEGTQRGQIVVTLPAVFDREVGSGLPTIGRPHGSGGVRIDKSGRRLTVNLSGARAGTPAEIVIPDRGIPAGTYDLPVAFVDAAGRARSMGTIELRFYAPVRESENESPGWSQMRSTNVSDDATDESETYITAVPGNPLRLLVGANGGTYGAWLSTDGGVTWAKKVLPPALDVAQGDDAGGTHVMCCDPMSAANAEGDIWYGGLSCHPDCASDDADGFIVVNRIAAGGTEFQPKTVALPRRKYGFPIATAGIHDKPMMTMDNSPSSPTFGRLYVTWNEPDETFAINVVVSMCDTRPGGGGQDVARCDDADNWTAPADITDGPGSYIYADVAVGPDGTVYAVWWDFSSENAIVGSFCKPTQNVCQASGGWSQPETVAVLDRTNNTPVPFACPIMAQPGGRAAPAPTIETDISEAPSRGRVYVAWGDLRADSGTTRCSQDPNTGEGNPPEVTHDSWDSFFAAALNEIPGGIAGSATVGTRIATDGEGGGQSNSEEWFPALAVDQTTGTAYAAFYSTRFDFTTDERRKVDFFVRTVGPGALGPLERVTTEQTDYSNEPCCDFGNQYGDYAGIDATCGSGFPVWSDKSGLGGTDGEAFTARVTGNPQAAPCLTLAALEAAEVVGDGDGTIEPGETIDLKPTLRNNGPAAAEPSTATISTLGQAQIVTANASFPGIPSGGAAGANEPFRVKIDPAAQCLSIISFTAAVTAGTHTTRVPVPVRVQGPNGVCRVAPRTALKASTATAAINQPVVLDASASQDVDGTITRFEWDFDGNGVFDQTTSAASTTTTYTTAGARTAKVRVTDDEGDAGEASTTITINVPETLLVTPTIRLNEANRRRRASRGRLKLTVTTCARCTGRLVLKSASKVRDGKRRRVLNLGTYRYTASASGRAVITVKLSKANQRLLRRLKSIRLRATITATSPEKLSSRATVRLTLLR
jgi:PKD repeat protein